MTAYEQGFKAGKQKQLTENIQGAVIKIVNQFHQQVIFFRAFTAGLQHVPQSHLSAQKQEKLAKFATQLEQILSEDP